MKRLLFLLTFLLACGSDMDYITEFIQTEEGGYNEAGNSMAGITQPTYDDAVTKTSMNPMDVKDLSERQINRFYRWYLFEDTTMLKDIPVWVRLSVGDYYFNSPAAAVKALQELVGVEADGVYGHRTRIVAFRKLEMVGTDKRKFLEDYTEKRVDHYLEVDHKELIPRCDRVLKESLRRLK